MERRRCCRRTALVRILLLPFASTAGAPTPARQVAKLRVAPKNSVRYDAELGAFAVRLPNAQVGGGACCAARRACAAQHAVAGRARSGCEPAQPAPRTHCPHALGPSHHATTGGLLPGPRGGAPQRHLRPLHQRVDRREDAAVRPAAALCRSAAPGFWWALLLPALLSASFTVPPTRPQGRGCA